MSIFSKIFGKQAGGSIIGNVSRDVAGFYDKLQGITKQALGLPPDAGIRFTDVIGSGSKIEKGQKYTNKQINGNPLLYVTPGEDYTNEEIDGKPSLGKGYYTPGTGMLSNGMSIPKPGRGLMAGIASIGSGGGIPGITNAYLADLQTVTDNYDQGNDIGVFADDSDRPTETKNKNFWQTLGDIVPGVVNTIKDVTGSINKGKETLDDANKVTKMLKWILPAVGGLVLVLVLWMIFGRRRSGRAYR